MICITILLATLSLILFYWEWIRKFNYWKRKGMPYLPGSFPFGSNREVSLYSKFQGHLGQDLYNKLAPHPFAGIYIWNQPFLLVRDPEILRTILIKDFQHFRNRGRFEGKAYDSIVSQHLFSLDGDLWRTVRLKLTPTFTSARLKNMFSLFEACASQLDKNLIKILTKEEPIDIKNILSCFTFDVIASCAFGLEPNSTGNDEFRKSFQKFIQPRISSNVKIKYLLCLLIPFIQDIYHLRFIPKVDEDFVINFVKNAIKYREENNLTRNDFLDLMIQLKNKGLLDNEKRDQNDVNSTLGNESVEFTTELVAAQCLVFFLAGFETSSSVQTFAVYELALNQDIQARLHQEIDEVMKRYNGRITYQAFQEMHYMEQVIQEVIRKYPTIPLLTRQCNKTFTLPTDPKLTIEEGTKILIPVYALHHDPQLFPDPDKFDPERFSPENKSSITPCSYLPFGEGPRKCLGMRFGWLQTKMGIYTLLRKYNVLTSKETPKSISFSPTTIATAVTDAIKLVIKPREDMQIN